MLNTLEKEQIIVHYTNSKNMLATARHFKRGRNTIVRLLTNTGIVVPKEKLSRLYCNDTWFKNIDNPTKSYFLGLLLADGCNHGKSISLSSVDKHILEKFKEVTNFTGKIYEYSPDKSKVRYTINIPSIQMCQDLNELGICPRKSHIAKFPNIDENLYSHFIRGYFDGDGCIGVYPKSTCIAIMGNRELLCRIQEILWFSCRASLNKLYASGGKENIVYLRYGSKKDIKNIINYLYKDAEVYLHRKRDKALNFINLKHKQ